MVLLMDSLNVVHSAAVHQHIQLTCNNCITIRGMKIILDVKYLLQYLYKGCKYDSRG